MKKMIFFLGWFLFTFSGWVATSIAEEQRDRALGLVDRYQSLVGEVIERQAARDSTQRAEKETEWAALVEALIWEESRDVAEAVGDGGDAVGVLQLHPCVIDDVQAAGYDYTLDDRLDRERSIAIWLAWQEIFNPGRDIHFALKLQNPRASVGYHRRVIAKMNEIISTLK